MCKHTKAYQMTGATDTINFTIDVEKKKKFYGLCIQHETTMTAVLRQYVTQYLDENKPRFIQVG